MKKTLLFVLLGAAAGVAGYQIYKKHAEQAEDIYAQEASEHQFGAYISKPVKTDDTEPEAARKESSEEPEATADDEVAEVSEEATAAEPKAGEELSAETVEAAPTTEPVADAVGDGKPKKVRKSEAKKD